MEITIMKEAFNFIETLSPLFIEVFGYPTVKIYSDEVEVYFDTANTIRNLELLAVPCSSFRMFSKSEGLITICFVFDRSDVKGVLE